MKYEGKILLVDDEAHVRKFIALILKQLGATTIMEAGNGRDAVEVFKREQPNMVLLDVNMPIQDGIQTLREIRALSSDCVVVMLTSLANRQTVEEALHLGADNYIRKDTPKDEILASLKATIAECFTAE
jgi:two-component system, chemotaxis family, chemotaxis protein CheY